VNRGISYSLVQDLTNKIEANLIKRERVEPPLKEAGELTAIFAR
jgi:hypothetical protein